MWIANDWVDYELLDCTSGERLERWRNFILVRPDPQVIWHTARQHPAWRTPDARYQRSDTGGGGWLPHKLPKQWDIAYDTLRFHVGPMNFKHTGIFPEQAANWRFLKEEVSKAPCNVLNLFSYTGAATIACAAAGATVTHVDAAKGMVQWAKDNAALSGLSDKPIRWIVDDCGAFVARELRRGKTYDAIILDPPSFGRGPTGQTWHLEEHLYDLLSECVKLLSDTPRFILLNTYTTGLAAATLQHLLDCVMQFRGNTEAQELGLPITTGGVLPCGASARWRNTTAT